MPLWCCTGLKLTCCGRICVCEGRGQRANRDAETVTGNVPHLLDLGTSSNTEMERMNKSACRSLWKCELGVAGFSRWRFPSSPVQPTRLFGSSLPLVQSQYPSARHQPSLAIFLPLPKDVVADFFHFAGWPEPRRLACSSRVGVVQPFV